MTIKIQITIYDEGALEAFAFTQLISRVEYVSRNAAVFAALRTGSELELAPSLLQIIAVRIFSYDDAFFWIEDVRPGSKIVWGKIIAGAIVTTVLNNTIGESIKDGWHHTKAHQVISDIVPKIENHFITEFKELISPSKDSPDEARITMTRVAHRRQEDDSIIEIFAHQKKTRPAVE